MNLWVRLVCLIVGHYPVRDSGDAVVYHCERCGMRIYYDAASGKWHTEPTA